MRRWFTKLMQHGHGVPTRLAGAGGIAARTDEGSDRDRRDARYDTVVQMLRDREAEDRSARERRQRGYRQSLESDAPGENATGSASAASGPVRLYRFRTRVPCRTTPEARALLEQLRKRFAGCTVSFPRLLSGQQAVMLTGIAGAERKQIGRVEHCVQSDPKLCQVRHHGLSVETDDGATLVLRFRYPATPVRTCGRSAARSDVASVDFSEIRPALDPRPADRGSSPRLVWLTRPEVETLDVLRSRDYEAFYVRFKLEVLAGLWSALSSLLSSAPTSRWHRGSCYTVVREADPTNGRIHQRTVDDSGRAAAIGSDRTYDAAPATDILLLYLDGDILADIADIYFTLQSLGSNSSYFLKEELFTVIRRFWAGSQSLAWRYNNDPAAVVRMCQRALPLPYQASLLKQDWTNLRQSLVDRYGEGGRKAEDLVGHHVYRPRTGPPAWPFTTVPAGEINLGLRLVYRQEWNYLGAHRGEVVRTVPPARLDTGFERTSIAPGRTALSGPQGTQTVETIIEPGRTGRNLEQIVGQVIDATVEATKWPVDRDGSICMGVRSLATTTDNGLDAECRESSRESCTRLDDIAQRVASRILNETTLPAGADPKELPALADLNEAANGTEREAATYVYSRLQHRYELLTRTAEVENVVLVAEKLPAPAEIDLAWVRRHDWILAKVLLDQSFREALATIGRERPAGSASTRAAAAPGAPDAIIEEPDLDLEANRDRLYEHLRANILHYQRAIWQHEDPHQRSMRYRKSGKRVPLDWRFELESGGALPLDELCDRLAAANVDGQFAAYSGGRDADLEQVIDPAGPIGYYGNYAVFRMRPELGSGDLFSMLHLFKSPYLHPSLEAGEPEVADPAHIETHRDSTVDVGRRRQRSEARRIVVESDGVVIDVIRSAGSSPPHDAEGGEGASTPMELIDENGLILESGPGVGFVESGRFGEGAATIAPRRGEMAILVAGAGCATDRVHETDLEAAILANGNDNAAFPMIAGRSRDPEGDRLIFSTEQSAATGTGAAAGAAYEPNARVILTGGGDEHSATLLAGGGSSHGQMIITAAGSPQLASTNGWSREVEARVVLPSGEERLVVIPRARREHGTESEPVIRACDGERSSALYAGPAHDREHQQLIFGGENGSSRLTAVVSAGAADGDIPQLVASLEGGPRLLAGAARAHDAETRRVILAGLNEDPACRVLAGSGVAKVREVAAIRTIVARGDGKRTLSLLAGAGGGTARTHEREPERLILAQDDEWLRPSLVAG